MAFSNQISSPDIYSVL